MGRDTVALKTLGEADLAGYWIEIKCRGCGNSIQLPPWALPGFPDKSLDFSGYQCKRCSRFGPAHSFVIWSEEMDATDLMATASHVNAMVEAGTWT